jgi:hypothetical protein
MIGNSRLRHVIPALLVDCMGQRQLPHSMPPFIGPISHKQISGKFGALFDLTSVIF